MKKLLLIPLALVAFSTPAFAVVECIDQSYLSEQPEHSWVEGSNYCWVQNSAQEIAYMEAHWSNLLNVAAAEAAADSSIYVEGGDFDLVKAQDRYLRFINAAQIAGEDYAGSDDLYYVIYDMSDADFDGLIENMNADENKGPNSPAYVGEVDKSDNSNVVKVERQERSDLSNMGDDSSWVQKQLGNQDVVEEYIENNHPSDEYEFVKFVNTNTMVYNITNEGGFTTQYTFRVDWGHNVTLVSQESV